MALQNRRGERAESGDDAGELQAVFVYLPWIDVDRLLFLSETVETLLKDSELGFFDGDEVDEETTILFFYGTDAEALFAYIWPILRRLPFCVGARVTLRTGSLGAATRTASI